LQTDAPGVQVYTGNFLNGTGPTAIPKKRSQAFPGQAPTYQLHSAITFEAQRYIGAANIPAFPTITLAPGEIYTQHTAYEFSHAA
jgi:aldose 1-epimerase